jgi:hypothetical protein
MRVTMGPPHVTISTLPIRDAEESVLPRPSSRMEYRLVRPGNRVHIAACAAPEMGPGSCFGFDVRGIEAEEG